MHKFFLIFCFFILGCQTGPKDVRPWEPSDHQGWQEPNEPAVEPNSHAQAITDSTENANSPVAAKWIILCAGCHGKGGQGFGPALPPGAKLPNMMDDAWQKSRSDAQLKQSVLQGRGAMPSFAARLRPEEVDELIAWVRTLNKSTKNLDSK